jgi:DNA-binding transcriptional ArsR family regulator/uncharacterized protein YndB with AHSA1/START domain
MEAVFKALSDPNRRHLLDLLRLKDGQTLTELESQLSISRFGVMKHLKLLEKASLVVTRKVGRQKYHYLNPIPIQEITDRWISAYSRPWAQSMTQLKDRLERNPMETILAKPKHVYTTIIKTTPEKLWEALTTPQMTEKYYYGMRLKTDLVVGSSFNFVVPSGESLVTGTIVEIIPFQKLVTTFQGHFAPGMEGDKPTRVTYEIQQVGECCQLTLIHDGFENETTTFTNVGGGWPGILSGLKTLLETGAPLNFSPQ